MMVCVIMCVLVCVMGDMLVCVGVRWYYGVGVCVLVCMLASVGVCVGWADVCARERMC